MMELKSGVKNQGVTMTKVEDARRRHMKWMRDGLYNASGSSMWTPPSCSYV